MRHLEKSREWKRQTKQIAGWIRSGKLKTARTSLRALDKPMVTGAKTAELQGLWFALAVHVEDAPCQASLAIAVAGFLSGPFGVIVGGVCGLIALLFGPVAMGAIHLGGKTLMGCKLAVTGLLLGILTLCLALTTWVAVAGFDFTTASRFTVADQSMIGSVTQGSARTTVGLTNEPELV